MRRLGTNSAESGSSPEDLHPAWQAAYARSSPYETRARPPEQTPAGGGRLACNDLSVHIGGVRAVSEVSLSLRQGEVLGLIGPNGAGKTTLLNLLSGYMVADRGRVLMDGEDVAGAAPHRLARKGIARTFQAVRLFEDLSLLENVEVASLSRYRGRASARAQAREALTLVGLSDRGEVLAGSLPYGAQRQAAIARAVALRPRFLLLDEPAAGLNEEESRELAGTIRGLCEERGIGILLVEHDMEVAMGISDRMHVLDSGLTISEGTPDQVQKDPAVITAYLGVGHDA